MSIDLPLPPCGACGKPANHWWLTGFVHSSMAPENMPSTTSPLLYLCCSCDIEMAKAALRIRDKHRSKFN